ncbi:hypothetical protein CWI38_0504p0020 [Hamiltosporidium tvaerminnensis]|uniref:DNA replication complex GINS protein PSF1 n=1 Tax=Hamiltosporidium tvaerminnensis TaxID=1176355 RepID=A0A4V2JXU8_9MICR|nr:hypothetical protein CWI37_1144p0010 [Hamiltosporidium tvaerminnensis]TBU13202.1 hypothetical protein CWI38_0504p0020 [Hamiltosporidium tvaerminnensis]
MKFGKSGIELLNDCKMKVLTPINKISLQKIESENNLLEEKMKEVREKAERNEVSEKLSTDYFLLKKFKERNERIRIAYQFSRCIKIQNNYFKKDKIQHLLSDEENKHSFQSKQIFDEYFSEFGILDFIDEDPPLNNFVQILTLDNCGVVLDGNDFLEMKKNKLYFVKKKNIKHLIDQGLVKMINN